MAKQRGDVIEEYAGLGKVRYRPYVRLQINGFHGLTPGTPDSGVITRTMPQRGEVRNLEGGAAGAAARAAG